jgi:hypothetical protein
MTGRRQGESHAGPQQRVRYLQQDARSVTGLGLGRLRAPVGQPFQCAQSAVDGLGVGLAAQAGD